MHFQERCLLRRHEELQRLTIWIAARESKRENKDEASDVYGVSGICVQVTVRAVFRNTLPPHMPWAVTDGRDIRPHQRVCVGDENHDGLDR